MNRYSFPALVLVPLLLAACGDDAPPTATGHPGVLEGAVVDTAGQPVAGAFVNLGYTVVVDADTAWVPPLAPATLPKPDSVSIQITDHRGDLVWAFQGDPDQFLFWDGNDLAGEPAPDGPYFYHLIGYTADGDFTAEKWLVLARSVAGRARVADVRTDDAGRFSIPVDALPIWKTYVNPDPAPGGPIETAFGKVVTVYAYPGDGSAVHDAVRVDLGDGGSHALELRLPGPAAD